MAIDKRLQQEYADQDSELNKVLRYVSADKDNGYWRDKKNLPINVIPFPFKKTFKEELEELEKERKRLEKDKQTGTKTIIRLAERSTPPPPYGEETFGWPEYRDYLEKIKPGAIPLSFPKFMDQIDMRPEDYWGRMPRRKEQEGVMRVVAEPMAWQKKYLLNFYPKKYLDNLNRDDLEKLFDEFLLHRATRGRA